MKTIKEADKKETKDIQTIMEHFIYLFHRYVAWSRNIDHHTIYKKYHYPIINSQLEIICDIKLPILWWKCPECGRGNLYLAVAWDFIPTINYCGLCSTRNTSLENNFSILKPNVEPIKVKGKLDWIKWIKSRDEFFNLDYGYKIQDPDKFLELIIYKN